jgi:CRISPR/Cas system-associated endoribonuclease Cas2
MTQKRSAQMANTQGQQLDRIQQGVANGTVSEKEAAQLLDQQARIAKEIARSQSDGVVTSEEQAKIRMLQMGASLGIHQATSSRELSSFGRDRATTQAQAQQVGQIADGIRSGDLTGREASVLLRNQANLSRDMVNARADGKIDISERMSLSLNQWQAGRDIQRESSDFEKAPHARKQFHILPVKDLHILPVKD